MYMVLLCTLVTQSCNLCQELEGKISISLDAWTSSNLIAFMAIVAHYVNNDGQLGISPYLFIVGMIANCDYLEELLIDFRELHGQHSGENMAEAVWETLTMYNIQHRYV
jgi:hypothetical protein